jgi:hypothetical protein
MYGRLRNLIVRVEGSEEGKDDKIIRRFPVIGAEQPVWLDSPAVASAARQLFSLSDKRLHGKSFRGDILFENSSAFHDGKSVNAGIAFLWFTGIQAHLDVRERYSLQPNICITGDVDEQGSILPVAGQGIGSKTEAAFFSGTDYLIVPASQLLRFMEAHDNLRKKFPNRNLAVLGMDSLQELLYDRRLTTYRNPSKITFALQKAWDMKFETAGFITILVLIVVIFRLVYGPLDRNPAIGEFEGEFLNVKNQNGQLIESIEVGEHTVNTAVSLGHSSLFIFNTGNGRREIIWGETGTETRMQRQNGTLNKKSILEPENDWIVQLNYELFFPNKPETFQGVYLPRKLLMDQTRNDDLISVISHTPYFPGIISIRDSETGDEKSHYVNTGIIFDAILIQHEEEEDPLIVFSGVNNAFDVAFVGIINPTVYMDILRLHRNMN